MKYMIDGSSSAPVPKARRWLVQYPEASNTLLKLLTTKTIDYLVAQVKAGAQVSFTERHLTRNCDLYLLIHQLILIYLQVVSIWVHHIKVYRDVLCTSIDFKCWI